MKRGTGNRRRSDKQRALERPSADHVKPVLQTAGSEAAARWRSSLCLEPTEARWYAEITLGTPGETSFLLNIYAEEWGFAFEHARRASWIRVTDVAFVHGRDDFALLPHTPDLLAISVLMSDLERETRIELPRSAAIVRTNLRDAVDPIREWLATPPPRTSKRGTSDL